MSMTWIHQGGIFFLFLMMGTVSGMNHSSGPISHFPQLSTLGSQLIQLQEQVEVLQQENIEDKQQIVDLERKVSRLESVCGSSEIETEISRPLMAIGGYAHGRRETGSYYQNSVLTAEVVNTSCFFLLPETRSGHIGVTTTDGKTLVCGGTTSSGPTASCLQFDYQSKSWKEHSPLLRIRYSASAVTLSRGTYVLGGKDGGGVGPGGSSEFLATGSSVWTQGPKIPGHNTFRSCAAKLSDSKFVILGGGTEGTQALAYDEEQDAWRTFPRLTNRTVEHSCVALGDIVLIAGGYDSVHSRAIARTIIFDTKTGSTREVAPLKYPRKGAEMVLYEGKPLIFGGSDGNATRSDGEMWNMETETWEEADIHAYIHPRGHYSLVTMAEEIECD